MKVSHRNKDYSTKKDFEEYVKCLIYNRIGICNSVLSKNIVLFNELDELMQRHPDYNEKTKTMKDMKIIKNKMNKKALEIRVIKSDGTEEDISWRIATDGKRKSNGQDLSAALRASIRFQVWEFKQKNNNNVCEICQLITDDIHADHIIQFDKLMIDFLKICKKNSIKIPEKFSQLNDGSNQTCFLTKDVSFESNWYDYHLEHAKLRILCSQCNLRRPKYKH
jgi:hypothetical protein